jgi:hypothetical protein
MTTRVRPESKQELEERTRQMREAHRALPTVVKYQLACLVEHEGIAATLEAARGEPISVKLRVPRPMAPPQELVIGEAQLEPLIEFLKFAREECAVMRENYDRIADSTESGS